MTSLTLAMMNPIGQWVVGAVSNEAAKNRSESGEMVVWGAAGVVLIGVLGGLAYWFRRRLQQSRQNGHPALFYGLCSVHGLDGASRRLLKLAWQHHRLAQPARLFTEPKWLDPAYLSEPLRARAAELSALRQHLFGISPPTGK
jgi:hypothetical protein